jgi:tetratricopeptide (TPR) repeat protein
MKRLAEAMQQNGQALDALKIQHEMVSKLQVKTLADKSELRSAMALASIERGKFNDRKSNKANTADAEDAIIQQLLDGTIHDANQAQLLIDRFTAELRKKDSIDMRRKLADAYMVAEKYEEALQEYRNVADKLGVTDPVLDKHIEKAYIAQLTDGIKQLRANPESFENPETQITDLEQEIASYRWRHAVKRAEMFPNDMQLQFDLGELQFERGMLNEAEATFTAVSENPQKRRGSLVYLGRCELLKNNYPKAAELLRTAVNEMPRMDKYKREAIYYLAIALENTGDRENALAYYRQINASMENYRDVPERMAALQNA